MYTIVGADGRQYGPISAEQLRQWLAEGRINAQTLVWTEGAPAWQPLATFPDLAAVTPPPIHLPSPAPARPPIPGKSKLAAGLLGILLGGWGVHRFYLGYTGIGVLQIVATLCTCGIGALWGFIEGILIISGNTITTDATGMPLKD